MLHRPAHAAASSLRTAYHHLQQGAAISGLAALGLLPFLGALPVPAWQTAGLLLLTVVCFGRTVYQFARAGRAQRRLRLEERFLRQPLAAPQLVRCLKQRHHLWTRSCAVQVLRRMLARPLPHLLLPHRKKQQLRQQYRRALAPVQPASFSLDLFLGLALLMLVGAAVAVSGAVPSAPWLFRAGLLSAPMLLLSELFQATCRWRARRAFGRLTQALAAWTLTYGVDEMLRPGRPSDGYRHTLLYRAPVWFGQRRAAAG